MRRHLLLGFIAALIVCRGNSFSGRLTAAQSINAEKLLRESLVRSIHDSAICYWTWQISINAELISRLLATDSGANPGATIKTERHAALQSEPLVDQQQYKTTLSGSVNYESGGEKNIDDLINNENFTDPKTHNTDIRSRPRPRKRRR